MKDRRGPPKPRDAFESALYAEQDRHTAALVRLLEAYPGRARQLAGHELGAAMGLCDMLGIDSEEAMAKIRRAGAVHDGTVLVPPAGGKPS